jgi:hypothetical protein
VASTLANLTEYFIKHYLMSSFILISLLPSHIRELIVYSAHTMEHKIRLIVDYEF